MHVACIQALGASTAALCDALHDRQCDEKLKLLARVLFYCKNANMLEKIQWFPNPDYITLVLRPDQSHTLKLYVDNATVQAVHDTRHDGVAPVLRVSQNVRVDNQLERELAEIFDRLYAAQ